MVRFTDLEYVELGDAYAAHDAISATEILHLVEKRREIEMLTEQGRIQS